MKNPNLIKDIHYQLQNPSEMAFYPHLPSQTQNYFFNTPVKNKQIQNDIKIYQALCVYSPHLPESEAISSLPK